MRWRIANWGRDEAVSVAVPPPPAAGKDTPPAAEAVPGSPLPCLMCGGGRVLWQLPDVVGPCAGCFDGPYVFTADGRRLAVALAERGPW